MSWIDAQFAGNHYTFPQVLRFAENGGLIPGIPLVASVEFVSPSVGIEVRISSQNLQNKSFRKTASYFTENMHQSVFEGLERIDLSVNGRQLDRYLTLHLNWETAIIESHSEELRYRIVVASRKHWQHGLLNPNREKLIPILSLLN